MSSSRNQTHPAKSPATSSQADSNNPTSAGNPRTPSISLPKGGGAIRGIGEKFAVNPATGTASLTVALPTSPGRSGFGPQLSLSYDSGSGNGPFGLGWRLSIPTITRKTDKGLPRYRDAEESDVFLLAGAEDLVPILDDAGKRISFTRTLHEVEYRVHLYRPRIDGIFTRIERWVGIENQQSHWRTISRENVTTIYGFDENSRIFDPHDARRIFSYLISLTFDDKGNATQYEYAIDDLPGVERASAHEANRTDLERRTQRYLKYVRYGNVQPYFPNWLPAGAPTDLPADWHFQIVFDYGDHRANSPTPEKDPAVDPVWPVRPDPFSTFRSGFEVRTYRRCERVLLFHQFAGQPDFDDPYLVRSTDFRYSDETRPVDSRNPIYTFIESVTQTGYRRMADGSEQRSAPPLEFFYSEPELHPEILTLTDTDSRQNLPEGLDGSRFQWVDLDGEGLTGILTEQNGGWGYKRNLSPINEVTLASGRRAARASFAPLERVSSLPAPGNFTGGAQFLDLTGEGRPDFVSFDAAVPGYFSRRADEDWEPHQTFASLPRIHWSDPNLKFVDLTGDGRTDVLITEDELYTFYPSLGKDGFGPAEHVITPWDEERGPRIVFADGTQTISLADLSGDGLSDLVRVRNGEVCYWPNLGYGKFGSKITMDGAPRFSDEESFDPRRIRFSDIDGSGTTDLLYIGNDGVLVSFNRSGNSWAEPRLLAVFPGANSLSSVQVIDLLSNGTSCLVWSSQLPSESYAPLRYVDLMGSQKPHLMVRSRNNLGAETRVSYAASTRFYLEDKRAGRPWITRLPFPVQVVTRVESYDWIGRSRFVTRYAYHHGYFDGEEREFRGFGMVEQFDTALHRDDTLFPDVETTNEDAASFAPPIVTRTWFHTGAFVESGTVSQQYIHEYWVEPDLRDDTPENIAAREALLLPDTHIEQPATGSIDPKELREAYRALKGSTLRTEVYSEDRTELAEHPYIVTEQNFSVRQLQPRGPNRYAVFLTHPRESVSYHYERQPRDPRVSHRLTLEVDAFGNVRRSVVAGYGRRPGQPEPEPDLSAAFRTMLAHDQARIHITATENVYTLEVNHPAGAIGFDEYRAPLPAEKITAELTGIAPAAARFQFEETDAHFTTLWSGANDVPYEEVSTADIEGDGASIGFGRKVVEHSRTRYRSDDLTELLPVGTAQAQAIPGESYRLALTPAMINRVVGATRVTEDILREGGYVRPPGETDWWIPSGRTFFSPNDGDGPPQELAEARSHFYQPRRSVNPFGAISRTNYDAFDLLPESAADSLGNLTSAINDYRVLLPSRTIDPNGNHTDVAFDCLGRVTGTAVAGKAGEGDSLVGFVAELTDAVIEQVNIDPLGNPGLLLGNATSRIVYDVSAYFRTRDQPAPAAPMVYTLARETHISDLNGNDTRFDHAFAYSDGFGRVVQLKAQAEPDDDDPAPRWIGSGWTITNNKGKPVRRYEPFFSNTHRFEFDRRVGVSSVLFYDPTERVVGTLHPNNSFGKTVFEAWRQATWDSNDTVLISDPRTDLHVGDFFRRLFGDAPGAFVSWHDQRIGGTLGDTPEERAANQDAAQKTAAHGSTPTVVHFDALGRTCLSVADNGVISGIPQRFATRKGLDAESKPLAVFDALGRRVIESCVREPLAPGGFRYVAGFDMAGNQLYRNSADAGERRTLANVVGKPMREWNARGLILRIEYDLLERPTHHWIGREGFGELLLERFVYGERHPELDRNLKGKLFRHYDSAGLAINERYDFKGNLVENSRQFAQITAATEAAQMYATTPDWSPINNIAHVPALDIAALDTAAGPLLLAERFTASTLFDAQDRVIQIVTPHTATGSPSVIQPSYNDANLLERVDVWIRAADNPDELLDPATADIHAVTDIDYNPRRQRTSITLGNGVVTDYDYEPETFRLKTLVTTRPDTFPAAGRSVQSLAYCYDPTGNVTRLRDTADTQNVVYFRNQRVEPSADYAYDALYRLRIATGREHLGQTGGALNSARQVTNDGGFRTRINSPGDGNAMGNYTEQYDYDAVGNILRMIHQVATGGWTRHYSYAEPSQITSTETCNRLSANSLPGDSALGPFSASYDYDEHGNMTRMLHLPRLTWDEQDCLQSTTRQSVISGMPETTYYSYDADGERKRKVTFRSASEGETPSIKSERLYFGSFEIYREYDNAGELSKERETVHVMDDQQRVAIVETLTAGEDPGPEQLVRYQFNNHLGSAVLELDHEAQVISYEEYFPYGATSYQAVRSQLETPKRYRYTRKERDEENDLYYYGKRYYAPWLGRWTATDPTGTLGPYVGYEYSDNNPVAKNDPSGGQPQEFQAPATLPAGRETVQRMLTALDNAITADTRRITDLTTRRTTAQNNVNAATGERQRDINQREVNRLNTEIQTRQQQLTQLTNARTSIRSDLQRWERSFGRQSQTERSQRRDVLTLTAVIQSEARASGPQARSAVAHAWLNRTGGVTRGPENGGEGADLSRYRRLSIQWDRVANDATDSRLFLISFAQSLRAATDRLVAPGQDPTQGATHWVSPGAMQDDINRVGSRAANAGDDRDAAIAAEMTRRDLRWRTNVPGMTGERVPLPRWAASTRDPAIHNPNFAEITATGVPTREFVFYRGVK